MGEGMTTETDELVKRLRDRHAQLIRDHAPASAKIVDDYARRDTPDAVTVCDLAATAIREREDTQVSRLSLPSSAVTEAERLETLKELLSFELTGDFVEPTAAGEAAIDRIARVIIAHLSTPAPRVTEE